jgi:DNA-binding CsgD family transcriptional regulator
MSKGKRTEDKVLKELKSNKSTNEISVELGVTKSTITNISKGQGVSLVDRNKRIRDGVSPKSLYYTKQELEDKIIKKIQKGKDVSKIANKYGIDTTKVRYIAKKNNLTITRKIRYDQKRLKKIVKAIKKGEQTYSEIGKDFGISKARVYQFALDNDLRRNVNSKAEKLQAIKDIEADIASGMPYEKLRRKHDLSRARIGTLEYHGFKGNLATRYRGIRNEEIVTQYKKSTAKEVLSSDKEVLKDPNRINSQQSVYAVAGKAGFKKYPKIGRRCDGGLFLEKEAIKIIKRMKARKVRVATNAMIADELNKKGFTSAMGKPYLPHMISFKWTKIQALNL